MMPLSAARLREVLSYDLATGAFYWRAHRIPGLIGSRAGAVNGRYRRISVGGRRYQASSLAWLYVNGVFPEGEIDHRDLDTTNDAIANLRPASHPQNAANRRRRSDNTSGFKGVSARRGRFTARITVLGRTLQLGEFQSAAEAHAAYAAAATRLHGEFARAG